MDFITNSEEYYKDLEEYSHAYKELYFDCLDVLEWAIINKQEYSHYKLLIETEKSLEGLKKALDWLEERQPDKRNLKQSDIINKLKFI